MISLPPMGHSAGGMSPRQTASLPVIPVSMQLFLFTFSCGKSFLLLNLQFILGDSFSICNCNFGVSMGGGEPGISLLYHLIPFPHMVYS